MQPTLSRVDCLIEVLHAARLEHGRTYLDDTFDRFQKVAEGGPGEFSDTAIDCFNIIGGFQSVFGVIALFFLLLTLRNRCKMH